MGPQKKRKNQPLAKPPHAATMKSRKRARQVTTLFHKYTREKDLAQQKGASEEALKEWDEKIEAIGGRKTYQEASQLSTSFHSTSKWVLGYLQRKGWLYGIQTTDTTTVLDANGTPEKSTAGSASKKKRSERRETRLLEIGAINTELLDASQRTVEDAAIAAKSSSNGDVSDNESAVKPSNDEGSAKKYRLQVRAIDLHSMHPGKIEEADFLTLPLPTQSKNSNGVNNQRYDVIVCSMVLNCVTTAEDRGEMLTRAYEFLNPGGKLFLTIPKLCLTQSPFVSKATFASLLGATGVGFEIEETKESPKVSFFICCRPEIIKKKIEVDEKWTQLKGIHKGKKFRNQFAVVLDEERVLDTR